VLDGRVYLCFAYGVYTDKSFRGTVGGVAVTEDFEKWKVLNVSVPDNRNMVIFPQRFGGKIVRLERPFAGYFRPGDPFDIWMSVSPDGRYWGDSRLVLHTGRVPWVNDKIGPAAPPVRTPKGWLTFFHGVDRDPSRTWGWASNWGKRYSAGLMLLDLKDPGKVIGLCPEPVLVPEPEYDYEARGYRDYVIFPGGAILEKSGEMKIYYGSADTCECLATADVGDLLKLCRPVRS
jgi:beta-1,4-mannooligosaccharide/beta-1,4-mannosyl-N-acetylglucosamine phosphorylase